MNPIRLAIPSFAAGVAIMYLFDPDRGKRRRAGVRDKAVKTLHGFSTQVEKATRDFSNRTQGVIAGARSLVNHPSADNLADRIRSRMGRIVSHPHAIEVRAGDGTVILQGPILAQEMDRLLRTVRYMQGVKSIENRLRAYQSSEHVSSLQGGTPRSSRSELFQDRWTPALRVAAGGLGGALMIHGLRSKGAVKMCGVAGSALLARSVANRSFAEMLGLGNGSGVIQFEKTTHLHAPVEQVFDFWNNYENFPRFMAHLKEVRDLGDGKSHWVAEGPAGVSVSWNAEITEKIENRLLRWRSEPGSQVVTEGTVRFERDPQSGTRITIHLSYKPPAGMLGHLIASLFAADPKREMDEDLVRLKSLIEIGKTRAHGLSVTREEITASAHARAAEPYPVRAE